MVILLLPTAERTSDYKSIVKTTLFTWIGKTRKIELYHKNVISIHYTLIKKIHFFKHQLSPVYHCKYLISVLIPAFTVTVQMTFTSFNSLSVSCFFFFFFKQDDSKCTGWILTNVGGRMWSGPRKKPLNVVADTYEGRIQEF